jgi:parallel beta-helix repeat protein
MHMTSTGNRRWEYAPGKFQYGTGITLWYSRNNVIMHNHTYGNADGILVFPGSSGNLLRGNLVTGNFGGIIMLGFAWDGYLWQDIPAGNTIRSNIVENSGWFDFMEFYLDVVNGDWLIQPEDLCMNTWEKNQFQTEFGPPGCFGIPVELDDNDVCALDNDD